MFKASCSSSTLEFYFGILSLYFSFMFYWVHGGLWAVWIFHIKRKFCYIQSGSFHVQPQWPETEIQPYFSSVVCFRKYSKAYKTRSNKTVLIINVFSTFLPILVVPSALQSLLNESYLVTEILATSLSFRCGHWGRKNIKCWFSKAG